jgi:hypothetical protein
MIVDALEKPLTSPIILVPIQGNYTAYANNAAIEAAFEAGDTFQLWGEDHGGHYITKASVPDGCAITFKYGADLGTEHSYTYNEA